MIMLPLPLALPLLPLPLPLPPIHPLWMLSLYLEEEDPIVDPCINVERVLERITICCCRLPVPLLVPPPLPQTLTLTLPLLMLPLLLLLLLWHCLEDKPIVSLYCNAINHKENKK
jgi:hypothetical protein